LKRYGNPLIPITGRAVVEVHTYLLRVVIIGGILFEVLLVRGVRPVESVQLSPIFQGMAAVGAFCFRRLQAVTKGTSVFHVTPPKVLVFKKVLRLGIVFPIPGNQTTWGRIKRGRKREATKNSSGSAGKIPTNSQPYLKNPGAWWVL